MEKKDIFVAGTLTELSYGKKYEDKSNFYRVSVKVEKEELDKLIAEATPYFEGVEEKYIPKWLTGKSEYVNLKSKYEVLIGVEASDGMMHKFDEIQAEYGVVTGSKVILKATLKDGVIYPVAIVIKELKTRTIEDYFT